MGFNDVIEPLPIRTMVLFFLVDTSASMKGSKIGAVNEAINDVIPEIKSISENNADAKIKVAALDFSSGARWLHTAPIEAENFSWNYLNAEGITDMGQAFIMLNEKLSRKEFMSDVVGAYAPVIFLMSDGGPTDDYERGLAKLRENNWFKAAIKVAVAIGDDANIDVLKEFTGNIESVLTARNPEVLKKMIRFVAVTASQIGSRSSNAGNTDGEKVKTKQDDLVDQITQYKTEIIDDDDKDKWE